MFWLFQWCLWVFRHTVESAGRGREGGVAWESRRLHPKAISQCSVCGEIPDRISYTGNSPMFFTICRYIDVSYGDSEAQHSLSNTNVPRLKWPSSTATTGGQEYYLQGVIVSPLDLTDFILFNDECVMFTAWIEHQKNIIERLTLDSKWFVHYMSNYSRS